MLTEIAERLRTQDNRMTANPMWCVQILVRDTGYDSAYFDSLCWYNSAQGETVYEEPEDLEGWEVFGYMDRWETVMVCFSEQGCKDYMALDGHNVKHRAHNGQVRFYVESWHRCSEMIEIRNALMEGRFLEKP